MTTDKTEKQWVSLTPDEKLQRRLEAWSTTDGIDFVSKQAEENYKARIKRFTDAMLLKKPDRIPILPTFSGFITGYYGYTEREVMYDPEKAADATLRGTQEFETDGKAMVGGTPGKVFDILDYKLFNWPGHGVGENAGWQFKEAEYMTADEYDDFIRDPSDYWTRIHMPRIMGVAEPLSKLIPAVHMVEQLHVIPYMVPYGLPEVQEVLEKFAKAGQEAIAWQKKLGPVIKKLDGMGYPSTGGGFCYAPFDFMGDTLRSTRGIAMDMYRRPAKLQEALERSTQIMIKWGASAPLGACPVITMPLHKGADGFMSDEQFDKFYWPSLLEVIKGLNREGLIPRLFAEGGYNNRLERIRKDLGDCKSTWHFDYTDMAKAKDIIGDVACLMGNVHASLLQAGTVEEIKAYCKDLIETAGRDGGYIFSTGIGIGRTAKVENVRAMLSAAMEYSQYK